MYNHFNRPKSEPKASPLQTFRVNLSIQMVAKLKEISKNKNIPMSTLVARTILRELDEPEGFNFNNNIDHIPYVDENTDASFALFEFIKKFSGLNISHLVLCKGDMGIKTVEEVLVAYRQLVEIKMIVEYRPQHSAYEHSSNYKLCKVAPGLRVNRPKKENKPLEGDGIGPLDDID